MFDLYCFIANYNRLTCVMHVLKAVSCATKTFILNAVTYAHVVVYRKSKRKYVLNWTKVGKNKTKNTHNLFGFYST